MKTTITRKSRRAAKAAPAPTRASKRNAAEQIHVFVYGTLLSGERNHGWIARSTLVTGEARTKPVFSLYDFGAYPVLVEQGTSTVTGEVYAIDEVVLAELDLFEGHPRYYQRRTIALDDGRRVLAYTMDPEKVDGFPRIESGNWRTRQAERAR